MEPEGDSMSEGDDCPRPTREDDAKTIFESVWAQQGILAEQASRRRSCCTNNFSSHRLTYAFVGLVLLLAAAGGSLVLILGDNKDNNPNTDRSIVNDLGEESLSNLIPTPSPSQLRATMTPTLSDTESPTFDQSDSNDVLFQVLKPYFLHGGKELQDSTSYQSKAFTWMGRTVSADQEELHMVQQYALACVFYATNGIRTKTSAAVFGGSIPFWIEDTNWLSPSPVCTWFGITCRQGLVKEIDLTDNRLTGTFPPEAGLLTSLQTLILTGNYFLNEGDSGHDWLEQLSELKVLLLGSNSFVYSGIPPVLGKLSNLEELDISYTVYYGYLNGKVFSNLTNLEVLQMGGNEYLSPITSDIYLLPNLRHLHVESSNVTGSLDFLLWMPQIEEVWLGNNNFEGNNIPTLIGELSNLKSLSLPDCGLTGSLPASIGNMAMAKNIWLQNNELQGSIPEALGSLINLKRLELHGNKLEGSIPEVTCNRTAHIRSLSADCDLVDCSCCTCCANLETCD